MYKKYLIVVSKKDLAGINIVSQLENLKENPINAILTNSPGFDFYFVDGEIIETKNMDFSKINKYDFIIFASKHSSEKKEKTLSIHAPGKIRSFGLDPESGKLSMTSAIFMKELFIKLKKTAKEFSINNYKISLEATHHGPIIEKPCCFIEIGSSENEWKDRKSGFVIAKTIKEIIKEFKGNPYNEVAIGIGGPHYCPKFTRLQENSNYALSHIIPNYTLPIKEELIKEAINKTQEEVDLILLDWKGIRNQEERNRIIKILDSHHLYWKKV